MPTSLLFSMRASVRTVTSALSYHVYTLFLFTKSDLVTTVIPVTCFAFGAAPLSRTNTISHALQAIFWMCLHVLGFCVGNQARGSITEDLCNKPWRPLPSGRITMANAMTLKVFVIALCMIISYSYSLPVFYASVFLWFFTTVYHEGCGERHYITKNILNALGYGCFALGETLIAASDRSRVDFIQFLSIFLLCCIIASTIQAQDFQDIVGDLKMGRRTLVIAYPEISRYTPLMTLSPWSLYLSSIWEISFPATIAYLLLGITVGLRFYLRRTPAEDRLSYLMYNIWLAFAFVMPGCWRMYNQSSGWVTMTAYHSFPFSCCTHVM